MKKTLSVFLAILMALFCVTPAFAAGTTTHTVTFKSPSAAVGSDAYCFVKYNGDTATQKFNYVEDPDGGYVYYEGDGQYYYYDDILFDDDKARFDGAPRYSPVCYPMDETITVNDGEQIVFVVLTNSVYDAASVVLTVNGSVIEHRDSTFGEYAITADRNLVIQVREFTDGGSTPVLLRNHYTMTLVSGDGYSVKTLADENNKVIYYGDTFSFRVKIGKGYDGTDMTVKAVPADNDLSEFLGDDADLLANVIDQSDPLVCLGTDSDGCFLYKTPAVTSNMRIIVSGVRESSKSNILAKLKRILRVILDALGIHISFLDDMMAYYTVNVDATGAAAKGVSYELTSAGTDDMHATSFDVMSGEGVTLKVTKKQENQNVNVSWTIGDKIYNSSNYQTNWTSNFNRYTGEYTWTAYYYITGIDAETNITISVS